MNVFYSLLITGSLALSSAIVLTTEAVAQETVTPVPEPVTGTAPVASADAQETHDQVAIQQLMKVIELSRTIAGGIGQLFNSSKDQKQVLDELYKSQTGPRETPTLEANGDDLAAGEGLKELAEQALNGAIQGPADLTEAFEDFRSKFSLQDAFELKDDELPSKKMLAELAARGAVAGSTAENSFKRANASMSRIEGYVNALGTSKDLKQSIDLNTRAMLELTQQTNESLRTQAAITSIISTYFMVMASEASEKDWVDGLKNFNR